MNSTYYGVMVANYRFIIIAEFFDDGKRIIEECGLDRKHEHNSKNEFQSD